MPETIVYLGNVAATLADNVTVHEDRQLTRLSYDREAGSPSIDLIANGTGKSRDSRDRRDRLAALEALHPEDRPYFLHLEDLRQLWWDEHSADPADWVECPDDPALAQAVANHFGCPVGRPDDWSGPTVHPHDLPGGAPGPDGIPTDPQLAALLDIAPLWRSHEHNPFAGEFSHDYRYLMTNPGQDAFYGQHLSTSAQPAAFNYGAISANTTPESTASSTLPGEITTAGGGLIRKVMTYTHTTGTATGTLTATWTANGTDSLPVTVAKLGVLNASSAGTLGYEKLLSSTATISTSGDALTVTFSVARS